jgi:hypothetical protein
MSSQMDNRLGRIAVAIMNIMKYTYPLERDRRKAQMVIRLIKDDALREKLQDKLDRI